MKIRKPYRKTIGCRVDRETYAIFHQYAAYFNVTPSEALRNVVIRLMETALRSGIVKKDYQKGSLPDLPEPILPMNAGGVPLFTVIKRYMSPRKYPNSKTFRGGNGEKGKMRDVPYLPSVIRENPELLAKVLARMEAAED